MLDPTEKTLRLLARSPDAASLQRKLKRLDCSDAERARLVLLGLRDGLFVFHSFVVHRLLLNHAEGLQASDLATLFAAPQTPESYQRDLWWFDQHNLHGIFRTLLKLVESLGEAGAELREALPGFDRMTRCAVSIALAAQGLLPVEELAPDAALDFHAFLLTMSFSDTQQPWADRVWGERVRLEQLEATTRIDCLAPSHQPVHGEHRVPMIWISDPERLAPALGQVSADAAARLLSRGYWDDTSEALGFGEPLLAAADEAFKAAFITALRAEAEGWLQRVSGGSSFGGAGTMIVFMLLLRAGVPHEELHRFAPLINTGTVSAGDRPALVEAILILPLELREQRCLRYSNGVDFFYAPHTPTDAVIERTVQTVLGWGKHRGHLMPRMARDSFAAWGEAAAPHLVAGLSEVDKKAHHAPVLLTALGALGQAEHAPILVPWLAGKATREAAGAALVAIARASDAGRTAFEEALWARKKGTRVGAALALAAMDPGDLTDWRRGVAERRLVKERAADVRAALEGLLEG